MTAYQHDPDVLRWGLHHLIDVCSISDGGSPCVFTHYDHDVSSVGYVREGYCESNFVNVENDEVIAHALQEELSQLGDIEKCESSHVDEDNQHASILAQDWLAPSKRYVLDSNHEEVDRSERERYSPCSSPGERSVDDEEQLSSPEMAFESNLDGEVGKRLNQMISIRHVPKVNGEMPSADEAVSDHQRLMDRLQLYDLVELKVSGDGNCQFRSLSDQIYRSPEHHKTVRELIVHQLRSHPELYAGYVPMVYDKYLQKISKNHYKTGEWGDHVTLQAAADSFGVKIFVITSFKDTCYIEILPCVEKSKRIVFLSFWAEVHYNSIYPEGDLPEMEPKKKKKWWKLGS